MSWTTAADLRTQLKRWWDRGALLTTLADNHDAFPRRLKLKKPASTEMTDQFPEVQHWIKSLEREAKYYRLVWREVNHRVLGVNKVPAEVWVDSLADALAFIDKRRDAKRFAELKILALERRLAVIPWLQKRPLRALELADDWPRLLDIIAWTARHPHPGLYLRQVDIPGVDSKFIESHRAVLSELFDLVLPPEAIDQSASGVRGFCRRYGFCDKPIRPRFRILDPGLALLHTGTDQDITVTHDTFARLNIPVNTVFMTENEINFLSFPSIEKSLVIFSSGYGFEALAEAQWLRSRRIYYWGDIDTHGFAILDQMRAHFPQAISFLMNRETLQTHQAHWGVEPQQEIRELQRLTSEETALYDDLRENHFGERVRLEQERVGFDWIRKSLEKLGVS